MTNKMTAAVFEGVENITIQQVEIPKIQSGDLLMKVGAAAICGTDVRIFYGKKTKGVRTPSILGHEFAGEIVDVGEDVAGWQAGDRVTVAPVIACGECYYCRHDLQNICSNRTAMGYEYDGAFAEYVRIPETAVKAGNIFRLPAQLTNEEAAISEPLSCCINGQENMGGVIPGDKVLIIGMGPIGSMHMLLVKAVPETQVLVSDPSSERRELAAAYGADHVIDPTSVDLKETVLQYSDNIGVDKVIIAVGIAGMVNDLLGMLRKGGAINFFAGFPAGSQSTIDPNLIHYGQIHVSGASASKPQHFETALMAIAGGNVPAKSVISHTYPLGEFDQALKTAINLSGMKTVVIP
jgi:L-iditol 2-dehydrogenase